MGSMQEMKGVNVFQEECNRAFATLHSIVDKLAKNLSKHDYANLKALLDLVKTYLKTHFSSNLCVEGSTTVRYVELLLHTAKRNA